MCGRKPKRQWKNGNKPSHRRYSSDNDASPLLMLLTKKLTTVRQPSLLHGSRSNLRWLLKRFCTCRSCWIQQRIKTIPSPSSSSIQLAALKLSKVMPVSSLMPWRRVLPKIRSVPWIGLSSRIVIVQWSTPRARRENWTIHSHHIALIRQWVKGQHMTKLTRKWVQCQSPAKVTR